MTTTQPRYLERVLVFGRNNRGKKNGGYLRILPAVHIGRALIETKNEQKHDETRIAVIQVSGCYKAWFLVPANQASTRASHRWGVDHHALYLVVQESWQTT